MTSGDPIGVLSIGIVGSGAVGRELARLLIEAPTAGPVVFLTALGRDRDRLRDALAPKPELPAPMGPLVTDPPGVVVLCVPDDVQVDEARRALGAGCHVVALADSVAVVDALLGLEDYAREVKRSVVVGAAASPALGILLAVHAAGLFDGIDEISIAVAGTAGPACDERRAQAARSATQEWRDRQWVDCDARSGPELVWFPEPVGALDCVRGDVAELVLLRRMLPDVPSLSVRVGRPGAGDAPRRHRIRKTGDTDVRNGGARVAVSGRLDGAPATVVYAAMAPAVLSSAVLAAYCATLVAAPGPVRVGGIAEFAPAVDVLRHAADAGVAVLVYEGID